MATKSAQITIPAIDIQQFSLKVVGDSPLIVHKWSEKAKRQMLEKMTKAAKTKGHDVRNPVADFINSLYWLTEPPKEMTEEAFESARSAGAKFGFPSVGFKAAAVAAGYRSGVTRDKVSANGAFHITGDMAEIDGIPEVREDMVRVGMGNADIRYRGEFKQWSTILSIRYNAAAFSAEQIVNLFNLGGFCCGIGEWRPEKGGSNGMFHVGN